MASIPGIRWLTSLASLDNTNKVAAWDNKNDKALANLKYNINNKSNAAVA